MGAMLSSNAFPVEGRTVVITGGSKGMGLQVGRQLAEKGANVMIVARDTTSLEEGIKFISEGAKNSKSQRFHQVSADVTRHEECLRVIAEATAWNNDQPPDIVWCIAGVAHPTLFVDTPPEMFSKLMNVNYLGCAYTAQAILKAWLPSKDANPASSATTNSSSPASPARHIIFTASFVSFYPLAGYAPYSPTKAAVRALSDTISQELNLYAGAHPSEPRIKVHTVFPASIGSEGFVQENLIKSDLTKMLEEGDEVASPEAVARTAIAALENGQEIIPTNLITRVVMTTMMGASVRGGFFVGLCNTILAGIMAFVMLFVRWDMDSKVKKWGQKHGASGMKKTT